MLLAGCRRPLNPPASRLAWSANRIDMVWR
jgi:hypothetical protein